jgi:radical SAM superfamily enzyme YgiQ (UPF0313 family)
MEFEGPLTMNVLLISPRTPTTFWSLKHAVQFIARRSAFPPLGLLTVAAMLPKSWNLRLVDLNVRPLDDADLNWCDYVMISAMIVHRESVEVVVARAQRIGRPIVGGGPLFTTGHEAFAGRVHAVLGEAEGIIDEVIHDMEVRQLQDSYCAHRFPDVSNVPVPRWDLIHLPHYATMPIQFSRGCPFDCEFCDVIVMNGRRPRTKSPEQMLCELDALLDRGWHGRVFVVDDNFIGNRTRVKEFLRALVVWRSERGARLSFLTEASIHLADDAELLNLMALAGFHSVFVGIETPLAASLLECNKRHNADRDLAEGIRIIQRSGIEVMGGFIVGFDNDPREIFDLQFDFIQRTGIATAMVGLLTALPKTRLYQRLLGEGRIDSEATGNNTEAVLNFVPKLDRELLIRGYRKLMTSLYEPRTYYQRVLTFLAEYQPRGPRLSLTKDDLLAFVRSLWTMGIRHNGRRAFWKFLAQVIARHPRKFPAAVALAIHGFHYRMVAKAL